MGITDKLKGLTKKAQDAAVEHEDQVRQAVEKAEVLADQRTGGQYHDQIAKAGAKAEDYVDSLAAKRAAQAPAEPPDRSGE